MRKKEEFCPLCIAPVIAIAGGGLTGAGIMTKEEEKKQRKQILIWSGVSIILSIIAWCIWIKWKGACKSCRV